MVLLTRLNFNSESKKQQSLSTKQAQNYYRTDPEVAHNQPTRTYPEPAQKLFMYIETAQQLP